MIQYFDKSHPHYHMFTITNNNQITFDKYGGWYDYYHMASPIKIGEAFNSFSYKVIKSTNNSIFYGIGSDQLKNDKTNQFKNEDFVGYNGCNGVVFDQKNREGICANNEGTIKVNDTIRIEVNLKAKKITWYKNENEELYTSQISQKLLEKDIYPVLIIWKMGDTVQMNF